ncbi:hypothetical protein LTR36_005548 [Oleoguttula mirabilis]|uniref:BTB domain-containing protein n=1 Tax=Oleoguttula mirabilis TaxID=1507867 RepID=A0AAV9JDP0_9PEZI|nr:hypothetical protein LTR36_005548 [Oleoguttula mirabilis]
MATSGARTVKRKSDNANGGSVKKFRPSFSDTITVLAGDEEVDFTVHRDLICNRSGFFKGACARGWKAAKEKTVRLPNLSAENFGIYLEALYDGSVDLSLRATDLATSELSEDGHAQLTDGGPKLQLLTLEVLCRCWTDGDFLQDHSYQNAVMDTIIRRDNRYCIKPRIVGFILENTQPLSGLQKWLADAMVPLLGVESFRRLKDILPAEFVMEMFMRTLDCRRTPKWAGRCKYHEHADDDMQCV